MDVNWTLLLPREAESVGKARRMLRETASLAGVDPEVSFDLGLALTEACANVIEHAGQADGYWVAAGISRERCWIDVIDNGCGFAPRRLAQHAAALSPAERERLNLAARAGGQPGEAKAVAPEPVPVGAGAAANGSAHGSGHGSGHGSAHAPGHGSAHGSTHGSEPTGHLSTDYALAADCTPTAEAGRPNDAAAPGDITQTAESGRGLMLIEALCDRVDIRNHPARGAMIHFERDLNLC